MQGGVPFNENGDEPIAQRLSWDSQAPGDTSAVGQITMHRRNTPQVIATSARLLHLLVEVGCLGEPGYEPGRRECVDAKRAWHSWRRLVGVRPDHLYV